MPSIYEQHAAAFSHVAAYVVLKNGERVATVAFQVSRSGLRVTAWVHWLGTRMQKGIAGGGGYDRKSAAAANAAGKITGVMVISQDPRIKAEFTPDQLAFVMALAKDSGSHWDRELEKAGFTVFQAV